MRREYRIGSLLLCMVAPLLTEVEPVNLPLLDVGIEGENGSGQLICCYPAVVEMRCVLLHNVYPRSAEA